MAKFAGLDVSLEATAICVVDETGTVVKEGKAASEPEAIAGWLSARGVSPERVGLEAGPLSPWLTEGLRAAGLPAICIETRRMKGVARTMTNKTDRKDARVIAQAMRVGWYSEVHVKSAASQRLRLLLVCRRQAVRRRVDLELSLRGSLKAFGIKLGKPSTARFGERVRRALEGAPELREIVEPLLELREAARRAEAVFNKQVRRAARADAACRLLKTAPGVGDLTALTFVATIDDPARLSRGRGVGPLLGLTPRRSQSGEVDVSGRISKAATCWRAKRCSSRRTRC